jgi:hypothetical protein
MPQERYFKNAQTWRQISTNVPPAMYEALRSRVTKELTMSHVLRELIQESEVMSGGLPQPMWSKELAQELAALRQEVAEVRQAMTSLPERTAGGRQSRGSPDFASFRACARTGTSKL